MATTTGGCGGRPMVLSGRGVVSSGHTLATQTGVDILRRGGNAADAAAGVGLALAVLQPHQCGIGGEAPTLVYSAGERRVWAISGHGVAPREATLERFRSYGLNIIPGDGFLPAVVPSAPATWILLLRRFGTLRLADVLEPALSLAEDGFPMYDALQGTIAGMAERFGGEWPSSAAAFLREGQAPASCTLFRQPEWAATFRRLLDAEAGCASRDDGLRAAHDAFYRGPIARRIAEFSRANAIRDASGEAHAGLLSLQDFADYQARVEDAVSTLYRGVEVHKCSTWTQGPVLLQALNLLEAYDLKAMREADRVHTVVECLKLAFADREFHYGDPAMADVPLHWLLSREYAAERRRLVDPARASMELRPGGREPITAESIVDVDRAFAPLPGGTCGDTTKLEVIDAEGNMVSATPSGGWLQSSPVIAGLGFPLGTRGQMFSLVPGHPNALAPGKRPRTTLTPSLATRGEEPYLSFGSPGGDNQDQWALLFLLNVVDFGMSLQEAVEAPTYWTAHFPSSFYPRKAEPGVLTLEGRIPPEVRDELAERGHTVRVAGDWAGGNTLAAGIEPETGVRMAAASPRYEAAYAAGVA